jgi:peptidoglycan/LPS O-acetylase OafA/YrhL
LNPIVSKALPSGNNLPLIDVLRGLAAFWVVLFHVRVDLWVGLREIQNGLPAASAFDRVMAWFSVPMAFGGSGVMLFFVLSGFCVHLPLAGGKAFAWKPYAARRFFRIYPPYLAAILLTLGCELVARTVDPSGASSPIGTVLRSVFMVQNYGPAAGQMAGNPSLWSLPVEMELYVVYPLFLWLLRRFGSVVATGVVAAVSAVPSLFHQSFPALDGGFVQYWLIWCAGALLAERWKTGDLPRPGPVHVLVMVAAFAIAAGLHWKELNHWLSCQFWAVGYGLVLWFVLMKPALATAVPPRLLKMLVWMGALSYSLYLVHFPLFHMVGAAWQSVAGSKPLNLLVPLVAAVIVVPVAGVFYRFVEAPSHRLARSMGQRFKESRST